ncbi:uncharacterized protein LOC126298988 isoform X2 [Schistocerca gregaria]|uniref:uncharacterized protein LOC126298988 isoform X2 n=1 Tax=Schistocerca gregaria TaxID=7010 RepID=UPI00211EF158|nr:uncharacterized protein LOC126298988 isoform X2 [Schistocerca gregaria]
MNLVACSACDSGSHSPYCTGFCEATDMSADFAEILIAEVSKRRCLWDIRQKNYHNRFICDQEWAAVANAVGSTNYAKNRWKSLRDCFRRELKKKPISSSGAAANARSSKWCYFQALMFLKDIMTPREAGTNVALECQQSLSSNSDSDTEVPETDLGESIVFDGNVDCVVTEQFLPSIGDHNSLAATSPLPSSLTQSAKRRHSASFERELLEMEAKKIKILESQAECEDRKFLLSLVPYFKQIEPLQKLEAMGQIIDVLRSKISNKT